MNIESWRLVKKYKNSTAHPLNTMIGIKLGYRNQVKVVMEAYNILKKDFPFLSDLSASVVAYGGEWEGQIGIEFAILHTDLPIPEDYKEIALPIVVAGR